MQICKVGSAVLLTLSKCYWFIPSLTSAIYIMHLTGRRVKNMAGNPNGSEHHLRLNLHRINTEFTSKQHGMIIGMLLQQYE